MTNHVSDPHGSDPHDSGSSGPLNELAGRFFSMSCFTIHRIYCGWLTNSTAIMADAVHIWADKFVPMAPHGCSIKNSVIRGYSLFLMALNVFHYWGR